MKPVIFTAVIEKFKQHADKTGWTYIVVPHKTASLIKPGVKRSYMVKGKIDEMVISGVSMIPYGEGNYIIALNADMRKKLKKQQGAKVEVQLQEDFTEYTINKALVECLEDEPSAKEHFNSLLPSHQRYYSKWIDQAKTDVTRAKRIAMTVNAMVRKIDFGEMLRSARKD